MICNKLKAQICFSVLIIFYFWNLLKSILICFISICFMPLKCTFIFAGLGNLKIIKANRWDIPNSDVYILPMQVLFWYVVKIFQQHWTRKCLKIYKLVRQNIWKYSFSKYSTSINKIITKFESTKLETI